MRKLNVNTAMPRPLKSTPQAKRVAPPAVPDIQQHSTQSHHHRHSGSSFCSTGGSGTYNTPSSSSIEDGGFTQTRDSPAALTIKDDTIDYGIMNVSKSPNSLNTYMGGTCIGPVSVGGGGSGAPGSGQLALSGAAIPPTAFAFPITGRTGEPLTHKAAVYYHQQLALQEDQGIDLTQSPGRDSPGSSSGSAGSGSRHSTASLDSGRASSYITGCTGTSSSIRGALSSPRCSSVSSCSIGSVDRMSQRSSSNDNDIIFDWLIDLKFDEYAQLFTAAGYDMPTITRMTPEDLTAIGIKNPQHRERIKQHIDNLQLPDGLPNFVPGSIEEWLRLLRLEEYIQPLLDQNYKTVRDVTQVTWEDLEDIGIVKLGHQKKILLAIKRVKDIISGKWNSKGGSNNQQDIQRQATRVSWDDSQGTTYLNDIQGINHENNEIVVIKIRQPRGKSLESLEDTNERNTRTHLTFSHYSTDSYYYPQHHTPNNAMQHLQQQQALLMSAAGVPNRSLPGMASGAANSLPPYHVGNLAWRRSYDDGDITPTNEIITDISDTQQQGGGTLPRQQRANSSRNRIIDRSSSTGGSNGSSVSGGGVCIGGGNTGTGIQLKPLQQQQAAVLTAATTAMVAQQQQQHQLHLMSAGGDYVTPENAILMSTNARYGSICSPLGSKKIAPDPPRRQCSIRNANSQGIVVMQQQQQQQDATLGQYDLNARKYLHYEQPATSCRNQTQQQYIPSTINQQPIYVNYNVQTHQTTAEIHCDKTHDTKSNSSIDSIDTIPFANENTGTIKQRLLNRQDISSSLSLSSSSSSSSTNTVANIAQSFHSLKSSGSGNCIQQQIHGDGSTGTSSSSPMTASASVTAIPATGIGQCCCSPNDLTPPSPTNSLSPSTLLPHNLEVRYHQNPNHNHHHTNHHNCSCVDLDAGHPAGSCCSNSGNVAGSSSGGGCSSGCCSTGITCEPMANVVSTTPTAVLAAGQCCQHSALIACQQQMEQFHMHQKTSPPLIATPSSSSSISAVAVTAIDDPSSSSAVAGVPATNNHSNPTINNNINNKNNNNNNTSNDSANVLNDIGNMLANLTDELDAMLEEEKRVGINDSE